MYRGVEILIGQIPGNTIQEEPQQTISTFCRTIPKEHEYLLFRDPEYELFIKSLDKNVTAFEAQMDLAGNMVQQIPTAGATKMDRKNLLGAFLRSSLSIEKPLPHVEIGSYMGFSGALTTAFAELVGFSNKSKVFMVSPKSTNDVGVAFNKTVERLGLKDRVTWLMGTNMEIPWSFGPAKSIYEDSSHDYAAVSQSILLINRYLVEGGLVVFHDVTCKHDYQGLQWVFSNLRHSPGWREVVLPFKQLGGQNCTCSGQTPRTLIDGCNYITVLQKRVVQPPLGLQIVVQGNMVGTTFESGLDEGAVVLYNDLGSFTTYMDFFNP
jgi:predicted O-methyltransferase YrrM